MLTGSGLEGDGISATQDVMRIIIISASILLPLASVFAAYVDSRQMLLALFLLTGMAPLLILRPKSKHDDVLLALVIWSLALSQLLSTTTLSNNIFGNDINGEFYIYLQVLKSGRWNPALNAYPAYNSVLSISILPTVITLVSGLGGVSIFEIVFPVLFSIVPVVLFTIFRKILPPEGAFLSAFLFIAYPAFATELVGLGRQEIGELLLALVVLALLSPKLGRNLPGQLMIMILLFGCVTAHYSLAFIFVPVLLLSYFAGQVRRRGRTFSPLPLALIALVVTFAWYTYVGSGVLSVTFSGVVSSLFSSAFGTAGAVPAPGSSGTSSVFLQATGIEAITLGPLHQVNRLVQIVVQVCLGLGFLAFLAKRRKTNSEWMILPLFAGGFLLLGAAVLSPSFAGALAITREYHIALFFISPCVFYGVQFIDSTFNMILSRLRNAVNGHTDSHKSIPLKSILLVTIMLSYFLFVSGWVWAVTLDRPTSVILDNQRMLDSQDLQIKQNYFQHFTVSSDVAGANWISTYDVAGGTVCSDQNTRLHVLTAYGQLSPAFTASGTARYQDFLPACASDTSYTFLSEFNSLTGIGYGFEALHPFPISQVNLGNLNLVYSDGATSIYAKEDT